MNIGDKTKEAKLEVVEGLTIFKVKISSAKQEIVTGDISIDDGMQAMLLAQEAEDTIDDLLDAIYEFDDRMQDISRKQGFDTET
jgi:hypothetical protein